MCGISVTLSLSLSLSLFFSGRRDDLDKKRFPYDDKEKFSEVVSLTKPQCSLVDFLKPFDNVCYILRWVDVTFH